ncbi:MAG: cytochrome c5 family protein [Halomonas sp. BM-2019]|nr:MAG: cytochrome c5 family protein [Halomonas sp. BM-2019]
MSWRPMGDCAIMGPDVGGVVAIRFFHCQKMHSGDMFMKRLATLTLTGVAALALSATVQAEPDGEAIYNQACMACHMTGAAGAPIKGDEAAWADRLEKGMDELYANSIDGIGAMPPRGGFANLSDEEVKAAVDFMLEPVL